MKTSPQPSTTAHGRETSRKSGQDSSTGHASPPTDDNVPLPHEADQDPGGHHDQEPHRVGKQAHHDVEHGLEDTDRRGGDAYQQRTQNESNANRNSASKPKSGPRERH
ncbi:hypothetical protein [Paraburkholderia saeva]|uniref:hypothetical protein n=1 Tax=Paraburkholderia saeva TaxID=2777537 RepID=UPI001DD52909|nr:hypothetical protein [Paraburkholderia saeva]CAG4892060.1 hypothetical protein R52603_01328 [Paraburkholderia saeva]